MDTLDDIATCNKAIGSLRNASNFAKWSVSLIDKYIGERVLEVGGGIGTFTDFFVDKEILLTTEIDDDCFMTLSSKYRNNNNVEVVNENILNDKFIENAKEKYFDTVICFNVLEHIDNDIEAIKNMKECIKKDGGHLIIRVPAFNLLYSKLDRNVGHFRRYTKKSMLKKLSLFDDLEIIELFYMDIVGFFAWFFLFKIIGKESFASEGQIGLYDKLFVPFFSKIEKMINYPFGLTLFAICRKKEEKRDD